MSSIVFIDSRVSDYELLRAGLEPGTQVVLLDPARDGLAQIAAAVQGISCLDAIHIISHGSQGTLYLGDTVLSSGNIASYLGELGVIGAALGESGDILLYGCDVGGGDAGLAFVNSLAALTDGDVAASTDLTGAAAQGGNWTLEVNTGFVAEPVVTSSGFDGLLIDIGITDTVNSSVSYTLGSYLDNLILSGTANISGTGNDLINVITGNDGNNDLAGLGGNDTLSGLGGNDTLDGGTGNDSLMGNQDDDTLDGGTGNDTLNGGTGADSMEGGPGNDTYSVDGAGDVVSEFNLEGVDTVNTGLPSYSLGDGIENGRILATGGASLTGNVFANILYSGGGNDSLNGGSGGDIASYRYASGAVIVSVANGAHATGGSGTDTFSSIEGLAGSKFADRLTGNAAANTLAGGVGNDTLVGGGGDDTYEWRPGEAGDDVINDSGGLSDHLAVRVEGYEFFGERIGNDLKLSATFGGLVTSTVTITNHYSTGQVEILAFGPVGAEIPYTFLDGVVGTAGADWLVGTGAGDSMQGGDAGDQLLGGLGGDTMDGGNGDDVITGGAGADSMSGGAGNDIYYVDNLNDLVLEADTIPGLPLGVDSGSNIDTIVTSISRAIATNIEVLMAAAGTVAISLTGSAQADNLKGNAGINTLTGLAGNDTLDGGAGLDSMVGGDGSDIYLVREAADIVRETNASATGGVDLVQSYVLATAGTVTLSANIEHGRIMVAGAANLTGNGLANTLTGGGGDDILTGGAGNDTLNGGSGADTASYLSATAAVTASLAIAVAQATVGAGSDTLINIENLTGSRYADKLTGNTGNNVLAGGAGNDRLTGGTGQDKFRFDTVPTSNIDTITDFSVLDDSIQLENAIFTKLTTAGTLSSSFFRSNASGLAVDGDDYVLYENDTGKLFYDADGSGAGLKVQIATLVGAPALTSADFLVI